MLRVIKSRLDAPRASRPPAVRMSLRPGSSQAMARETAVQEEDPFGNDFGAGPSSRPYEARRPRPRQANKRHINSTGELRAFLDKAHIGTFVNPSRVTQALRQKGCADYSDLDLHVILHHIIRIDRPLLAIGMMTEALQAGKRRRRISRRTMRAAFKALTDENGHLRFLTSAQMVKAHQNGPGSRKPGPRFQILLDLLSASQAVRHPRPAEMYDVLIRQAVFERLPDVAARIFVGMVEEWVTEGRVAEGAGPDDFYHGGGPPREVRREMAAIAKKWWTGVRTWRLPGEVISPHDRLDLWHPENLLLGEKMRNFPFPIATSPPSLVPEPDARLLTAIIKALRLDPSLASKADFEASMRALAILANTVLSRTLPVQSVGELLRAFQATPMKPPVYPIDMGDVPEAKKWAYEAYTHIHLALQSLLYAPPMSSSSLLEATAGRRAPLANNQIPHPPVPDTRYATPPLPWRACMLLVNYAISSLKQPKLLTNIVAYMRSAFDMGRSLPHFWNTLFRGASNLHDNQLAQQAEDALFDKTPFSRSAFEQASEQHAQSKPKEVSGIEVDPPQIAPQPDAQSLGILIDHLANTSQHERLFKLVYQLIPFLDTDRIRQAKRDGSVTDPTTNPDLRATYASLPPDLYVHIVYGLEKGGQTSLAFRVFQIAMQVEDLAMRKHRIRHRKSPNFPPYPKDIRLPIDMFTAMLLVATVQAKRIGPTAAATASHAQLGGEAAWTIYQHAKQRWAEQVERGWPVGRLAPTDRFFDATIQALGRKWKLYESGPLSRQAREEILELVDDMRQFRVAVPVGIRNRLRGEAADRWTRQHRVVPVKQTDNTEFSAVLANMLVKAETAQQDHANPSLQPTPVCTTAELPSRALCRDDATAASLTADIPAKTEVTRNEQQSQTSAATAGVVEWNQSTSGALVRRSEQGVQMRAGPSFWASRDDERVYICQA